MTNHDHLSFRVENITPILNVSDMHDSLQFYADTLSFKKADWGDDHFTGIYRDNTGLYLSKDGQGTRGTWIWIGFDGDIFLLFETLKSKGVTIKLPPTNYSWAYEFQVEDPDGNVLRFGTEPNGNEIFADRQ